MHPRRAQVVPPSPPVMAFEIVTLAAASGSTAVFFIVGAVCCLAVGGRSLRARHNSRFLGTRELRVDEMPYAREEAHRRGELWDGPVRNDLGLRGRALAQTSAPAAGAGAGAGGFTFSSLLGPGARSGFQSVRTS